MSRKKANPKNQKSAKSLLSRSLLQIERLCETDHWQEAAKELEELRRRHPQQQRVLELLAETYWQLGDVRASLWARRDLAALDPNDPDVCLWLARAYLDAGYAFLAAQTLQRLAKLAPDFLDADLRDLIDVVEEGVEELLPQLGNRENSRLLGALHDEVRALLESGRLAEAEQAALNLLERFPDFIPALNNLSMVQELVGRLPDAITTAQRALTLEPDNTHALSNLGRLCYFAGRTEEARAHAERLKSLRKGRDLYVKRAELLAILGDDEGVWETLQQARKAGDLDSGDNAALLHHLGAAAAGRLGKDADAIANWRRALDIQANFDIASENLADFRRPVGERSGPWYFNLNRWLPKSLLEKYLTVVKSASRLGNAETTKAVRSLLDNHPIIKVLAPALLDRGDAVGREFAFYVASMAKTDEFRQVLKTFALGAHGSDALRQRALSTLQEAGLLPSGPKHAYFQGQWRDVQMLEFQVTGEPSTAYAPAVEKLMGAAQEALNARDGKKAERLLQEALQLAPDEPSVLNNLTAAYNFQGRFDERDDLTRQIHARFPDYLFARTNLAIGLVAQGEIAQARELLQPLLSRKKFHTTEFAAICMAQIEIALAENHQEAARSWLGMWQRTMPDDPQVRFYEKRIGGHKWSPLYW
ncbi:MAG: tetratricopeptide repeat protein [Gemmataceae bacterium]|nr:tetratricopeptide repeat protein [Gemmataceae bacterium]MCI0741234.1 tetratricopeptide repeat protein [Gemmataceae bacterium]